MPMRPSRLLVVVTMLPLACGGDAKEARNAEAVDEHPPAGEAREDSGNKRSLAEHRRAFMEGCSRRMPGAADYCECGWQQMTEIFSEAELNSASAPDESKLEALRDRTAARCLGKLPESRVRGDFMKDCTGGDAKLDAYCDCGWTELRKSLSVTDIADRRKMESRRGAEARKAMASKCGAKVPEQLVRDEFMRGCLKVDTGAETFCA